LEDDQNKIQILSLKLISTKIL